MSDGMVIQGHHGLLLDDWATFACLIVVTLWVGQHDVVWYVQIGARLIWWGPQQEISDVRDKLANANCFLTPLNLSNVSKAKVA